jgi:hypothetical protein
MFTADERLHAALQVIEVDAVVQRLRPLGRSTSPAARIAPPVISVIDADLTNGGSLSEFVNRHPIAAANTEIAHVPYTS